MKISRHAALATLCICLCVGAAVRADIPARTFDFTYAADIIGLTPGQQCRVWIPQARSDTFQTVTILKQSLPAAGQVSDDAKGNRVLYFQAPVPANGRLAFSITYRITRQEAGEMPAAPNENDADDLAPNAMVPIGGAPEKLLAGAVLPSDPMQLAHMLYDVVDNHMQYRKDKPGWGRGDAVWACQSGFGNCTDFHSLFMSLARTHGIPCKFEMGFAIPDAHQAGAVAGYHCWLFCKPGEQSWLPLDISEANQNLAQRDYYFGHLDANRIAFTTGRDLELIPRQAGSPLNFFIYPYAEAAGKPITPAQIQKYLSYADTPPSGAATSVAASPAPKPQIRPQP